MSFRKNRLLNDIIPLATLTDEQRIRDNSNVRSIHRHIIAVTVVLLFASHFVSCASIRPEIEENRGNYPVSAVVQITSFIPASGLIMIDEKATSSL